MPLVLGLIVRPRLVARISRDLFLADLDLHQRRLTADVAPDFAETLYAAALGRP